MAKSCDIFVIGGGINGCGIARDAVGRGYSVCLAEMSDLASGTSSGSTKLVHGGLRYLEFYEFRLVREALFERERLWRNAPHIIHPLRFILPHHAGLRPAWMLRLGLFLYDYMGGRKLLPPTRTLDLSSDPLGAPLKSEYVKGFEYSDCWVDDARFVVLNARDAADRGAEIMTRTKVTGAKADAGGWVVTVADELTGGTQTIHARTLVNAAGPWVDDVLRGAAGRNDAHNVRLVKGSHVVVPKLYDHDRCYIFQNSDGRIIFAIPYEGEFTLLGTTDRDFEGDPGEAHITKDEIEYICASASEYFKHPVSSGSVVWTYSAVRPLYDDGASKAQEATRDYILKTDTSAGAPLFNVFGGKITTYRRLAESMLERIEDALGPRKPAWTADAPLPGGDMDVDGPEKLKSELAASHVWLPRELVSRLVRLYGTRTRDLIGDASSLAGMGKHFGADLYEREVRWLIGNEWARSAEDVLWRRTKLGLRIKGDAVKEVERFMAVAIAGTQPVAAETSATQDRGARRHA